MPGFCWVCHLSSDVDPLLILIPDRVDISLCDLHAKVDKGRSSGQDAGDKIPSLATYPWTQTHTLFIRVCVHIYIYIYIYIYIHTHTHTHTHSKILIIMLHITFSTTVILTLILPRKFMIFDSHDVSWCFICYD